MIIAIGLLAQCFFSARILLQWIMSERAREVLSPSLFWILSLCGSYLLCLYGWLRDDFSIVLGQFISYYIYLYNLKLKGIWPRVHVSMKSLLLLTPVVALAFVAANAPQTYEKFFRQADLPLWMIIYGSTGQVIFTLRFIYQMINSHNHGESRLPAGFWILSLIGSLTIVTYGIMRLDIVLILGQSFGVVAYIRNLMLLAAKKKEEQTIP